MYINFRYILAYLQYIYARLREYALFIQKYIEKLWISEESVEKKIEAIL